MQKITIIDFRCRHRHSAVSHPVCYLKYLQGDISQRQMRFPNVLLFDIETSPLKAYVFQKSVWRTNVGSDQVISEWFMLTWSAKWLFSDDVMSNKLSSDEAKKEDDSRLVKSLWNLLDKADIVIAHNGDGFDIPNMNTRFIIGNLPPPSPYQTIDTMLIARKQFGFTHNSLSALARVFGFPPKVETDFELWKRCVDGDEEALKYMQEYNIGDVDLLERVYLKLRPWIRNHPNIGLYIDSKESVCPNCGSSELTPLEGKYHFTQVSKFPLFTCNSCHAYGRVRTSDVSKEVRKNLTVGLPTR